MEGKGYDAASCMTHGTCVFQFATILQRLCMVCIQAIAERIHEFKFRAQLEEWQIEITSHANLKEKVAFLQL